MKIEYIKAIITETGKNIGSKEEYTRFNEFSKKFGTIKEVKRYIKERYRNCKRQPIFRDNKQGKAIKTGDLYCFRNQDISHNSKWWLQQDWVEIRKVNEKVIL